MNKLIRLILMGLVFSIASVKSTSISFAKSGSFGMGDSCGDKDDKSKDGDKKA